MKRVPRAPPRKTDPGGRSRCRRERDARPGGVAEISLENERAKLTGGRQQRGDTTLAEILATGDPSQLEETHEGADLVEPTRAKLRGYTRLRVPVRRPKLNVSVLQH